MFQLFLPVDPPAINPPLPILSSFVVPPVQHCNTLSRPLPPLPPYIPPVSFFFPLLDDTPPPLSHEVNSSLTIDLPLLWFVLRDIVSTFSDFVFRIGSPSFGMVFAR